METQRRLAGGPAIALKGPGPGRRDTPELYDARTGLATKSLFRDRTEQALNRAVRVNSQLAVVMLEVAPETKRVSESRALARALVGALRPYDTAAQLEDNYIGVLVEDVTGTAMAQAIRERLENAVPHCRASSVAVSDSRGRIGFWLGGSTT